MTCSLVSKTWYKASRKFLTDCQICYVNLRENSCISLSKLLAANEQMTYPPFNGIRVKKHAANDPRYPCIGYEEDVEHFWGLKIKYLELDKRSKITVGNGKRRWKMT